MDRKQWKARNVSAHSSLKMLAVNWRDKASGTTGVCVGGGVGRDGTGHNSENFAPFSGQLAAPLS